MTDEQRQLLSMAAGDSRAIRIGTTVVYPPLMVGGRAFQFDAWQNGFLFALQKFNGDLEKACATVGKPLEWAEKFMSTRKFREFRNAKLNNNAVSTGALFEEWRDTGVAGMRGYWEWYEGSCQLCHEQNRFSIIEAESFRQDDMNFKAACKICFQPVAIEHKREDFKPTREQVQFWSEIGARVSPKIERVHHEFSKENFIFETEDAGSQ